MSACLLPWLLAASLAPQQQQPEVRQLVTFKLPWWSELDEVVTQSNSVILAPVPELSVR